MESTARLDHVVINVRQDMDAAERQCRSLGFTVTPRGYHTLGSINHLMMFETNYFELIGIPEDGATQRADLMAAAPGINGLVFKTSNVDDVFAQLVSLDMDGEPPHAFSRPVHIDGEEHHARFRTVTVRSDVFPAGRVYFCEHNTPELVWRPEWLVHDNDVLTIEEVVVVTEDVKGVAGSFARLLDGEVTMVRDGVRTVETADARLTFRRPVGYRAQYGDLASDLAGRSQIFGSIVFRTASLAPLASILSGLDTPPPHATSAGSIVVRLPEYASVLEFLGPED